MARRNAFASTEVRRLELTEGDWIELKTELSVGDLQLQHWLLFDVDPVNTASTGPDGKPRVGVRPRKDTALVAELAVALVGWNLEDADGPVPLASTAEDRALQLAKLREPILEELREAYRRHYAGPAVEEKKEPTPITIGPS